MTRTATGAATGPVTEEDHRTPVLLSVNVGLPENVAWRDQTAPDPLEAPADGQVHICCARPGTDILLDM